MPAKPERIERAAIRFGGHVFFVCRPGRHHDVCRVMNNLGLGPGEMTDQGFTTNNGRFVDRYEACRIARAAGQIVRKTGSDLQLFSEDLW